MRSHLVALLQHNPRNSSYSHQRQWWKTDTVGEAYGTEQLDNDNDVKIFSLNKSQTISKMLSRSNLVPSDGKLQILLNDLGNKLGYKCLDDWYHIKKKELLRDKTLLKHLNK